MINFLGNESGFGRYHTNAYFETNNCIVFIDISMTNYERFKHVLNNVPDKKVYIVITHMHADHISGLPIAVQHLYYVLNRKPIIIVPEALKDDIDIYFRITGISDDIFDLDCVGCTDYKTFNNEFKLKAIETSHAPELRCFGYSIQYDDNNIVYTSDTNTLEPFVNYIKNDCELYVDASVHYGRVHLKLEDIISIIGIAPEYKVILMHLDNIDDALTMLEENNCSNYMIANIPDELINL